MNAPKYGNFILHWLNFHRDRAYAPKEILTAFEQSEGVCDRAEFYHELRLLARAGYFRRITDIYHHTFYFAEREVLL